MNLLLSDPVFLSVAAAISGGGGYDSDAQAYITAVETADGLALETAVKDAINAFVVGCKADGIWSAIKASCILAGARTLAGALVPLVGTAPTKFYFVAGDYNRKTGLAGDGSTKYLNSNRNNNADPQDSKHLSVYLSSRGTQVGGARYIAAGDSSQGDSFINNLSSGSIIASVNSSGFSTISSSAAGFAGVNRALSSAFSFRFNQLTATFSVNSATPRSEDIGLFARGTGVAPFSNGRIAFYSIGESLDLALLDARVTTLINAFAAAIP